MEISNKLAEKRIKVNNNSSLQGSYTFTVHDSITGKLLYKTDPIKNLIVSGSGGYGRNLVLRQLAGDDTYPLEIDSAEIGTGSTAPVDSNTDTQTPVYTGIQRANVVVSNDSAVFTFYITNTQLANGTYTEFTLKCGGRLFARSIITPSFTKGSNQNVTVDYTITLSAS